MLGFFCLVKESCVGIAQKNWKWIVPEDLATKLSEPEKDGGQFS